MHCWNHPEVEEGVRPCSRCGAFLCGDCLVDIQGQPYCAVCKAEKLLDFRSGTDTSALPYASIARRFAAVFIDRMLFGGAFILFIFLSAALSKSGPDVFPLAPLAAMGGAGLLYFLYEPLMLQFNHGQTLGKQLLRVRVVRADGRPISTGQAWGRSLLRSIMVSILAILNYVPAFVTPDRTCIHDIVAGTRVVDAA